MNKVDKIMVYLFAFALLGVLAFIGYELTEIQDRLDQIQYHLFHRL